MWLDSGPRPRLPAGPWHFDRDRLTLTLTIGTCSHRVLPIGSQYYLTPRVPSFETLSNLQAHHVAHCCPPRLIIPYATPQRQEWGSRSVPESPYLRAVRGDPFALTWHTRKTPSPTPIRLLRLLLVPILSLQALQTHHYQGNPSLHANPCE